MKWSLTRTWQRKVRPDSAPSTKTCKSSSLQPTVRQVMTSGASCLHSSLQDRRMPNGMPTTCWVTTNLLTATMTKLIFQCARSQHRNLSTPLAKTSKRLALMIRIWTIRWSQQVSEWMKRVMRGTVALLASMKRTRRNLLAAWTLLKSSNPQISKNHRIKLPPWQMESRKRKKRWPSRRQKKLIQTLSASVALIIMSLKSGSRRVKTT